MVYPSAGCECSKYAGTWGTRTVPTVVGEVVWCVCLLEACLTVASRVLGKWTNCYRCEVLLCGQPKCYGRRAAWLASRYCRKSDHNYFCAPNHRLCNSVITQFIAWSFQMVNWLLWKKCPQIHDLFILFTDALSMHFTYKMPDRFLCSFYKIVHFEGPICSVHDCF